jgi:tellurite resistance protein TehA-like permease
MLLINAGKWDYLESLVPFLEGFTMFFWSISTWWIPLFIVLGIWRHVVHKLPLRYHPQYWGMVFPIGMYTVCTMRLSQALQVGFIVKISEVFIYAALAAWLIVFLSLVYEMTLALVFRIRNAWL